MPETQLPTWDDCATAYEREQASALQVFIYHNEPRHGNAREQWREVLADVIDEVKFYAEGGTDAATP